jgi:hypothetical protein
MHESLAEAGVKRRVREAGMEAIATTDGGCGADRTDEVDGDIARESVELSDAPARNVVNKRWSWQRREVYR